MRAFRLQWELRNTLRSTGAFVTADTIVNTTTPGRVNNVVRLTPAGAASVEAPAQINIVKSVPGVAVSKTASPSSVLLPETGTAASAYPTVVFTSVARSTSQVASSYLRIADPEPCADTAANCAWPGTSTAATGNPYSQMPVGGWLTPTGGAPSPFETFTMTGVTASETGGQVDLGASTAWVLRYNGGDPADAGSYVAESMSVAAFNALGAAALENVVGVSITFQPTNPALGGTITLSSAFTLRISTQLRTEYRSTGTPVVLAPNKTMEVTNTAFTQLWDPIQNEGQQIFDRAEATVTVVGQKIEVAPGKSITPSSILAIDRATTPVSVVLSGDSANSTLPPKTVWLQDNIESSPDFWTAFELTGIGTVTAPSGADRVQIDLFVDGSWVPGAPTVISSPTFPSGVSLADATGIRATFSKADGTFLATQWNTRVPLAFAVRNSHPFPASGTETIRNEMSIQSVRDVNDPAENSVVRTAVAQIDLVAGSFRIAVNKESTSQNFPTRLAEVGLARPWTLTFQNTGTGALDIQSLVDDLGPNLAPGNPLNLTYATTAGGTLATVGVVHTYDAATNTITFRWPDGGRTMKPGEVFTIVLDIVLQPGLATGQSAFNTMVVNTAQTLSNCTNINPDYVNNPNMGVTQTPTSCGTKNFVQPATSLNLFVEKSVYGYRGTAAQGDVACAATTQGLNGRSYFPSPCLSDTLYSTDDTVVDQWLLRTSNTTTAPVTKLVVFDEVPVPGDKLLIGGGPRGSDYRPVLTGAPVVLASSGVTIASTTTEVTFSADACQGTWPVLNSTPGTVPCTQNGAIWVPAAGADWSRVAGIRVTIVFAPNAPLSMGKSLDVSFATRNLIASTPATDLASVVPIGQQKAWNQFGVQWQFQSGTYSQRIPSVVGVTPIAGPLELRKVVTGPAAGSAPDSFDFEVTCSIAQPGAAEPTALTLPDAGNVTISRDPGGAYTPARIDGIPVGATCSAIELGDVGEFGETSREVSPDPSTISIGDGAAPGSEVPGRQVVTFTNDYQFSSGLEVTKVVETDAVAGEFGPFDFALECATAVGADVIFDNGSKTLPFTISNGETFVAPDDVIPVGSTCTVTEVDSALADDITFTGTDVVDNGDGSATVTVGAGVAIVTVSNRYDVGTLTILKRVTGDGFPLRCGPVHVPRRVHL